MRIAVYVRVSTQRQAQTQTIEQQLERLRAHIQSQSWELLDENIFRDDGYSGATLNRPGLDRLRDKVKAAEIDRVLLTTPDRLARKYVHQALVLEELEQLGCQVEFLDRPMSQDPHDQLLLQIRGAVAEYERTLIAERMRRGRQMKLRAGKLLPWTHTPYGYRVDPDRPRDPAGARIEAAEAAIVQELFVRYLDDQATLFGLAQYLHHLGLPSPNGKPYWKPATLRGLLTNPAYTGQVYAGRTHARPVRQRRSALHPTGRRASAQAEAPQTDWVPVATIPAIVSQSQFDLVQAKLAHNQQAASRNNKVHQYLLRALVSCGVCHSACFCRTCNSGYGYYVCRRKSYVFERQDGCSARYAPAQELDALVWQDLCEVLTHPEMIAQALERAHGGHWLPQELQARRENLRRGQGSLAHQLDRLSEAYLQGVFPLVEYQRRRQQLEQKCQALETQEKLLDAQVDRQAELAGLVASVNDFCERVHMGLTNATFEQKRQLVELLIDRVIIANDEVEIRYVLPTSPGSEHTRFCHLRKDYFDAETTAILSPHQARRPVQQDQNEDQPFDSALQAAGALSSREYPAHCQVSGERCGVLAVKSVGRSITLRPLAQGARAAHHAADGTGDHRRLFLAGQVIHDRDSAEALVQKQAGHRNPQFFQAFLDVRHDGQRVFFRQDKPDRQSDAQVVQHHISGGHAIETRGAIVRLAAYPQAVGLRRLAIVGPVMKIHSHIPRLTPHAGRNFPRQGRIQSLGQLRQVFDAQFFFEVGANRFRIRGADQVGTDRFEGAPLGGDTQQDLQQVVGSAFVALSLQGQMLSQTILGVGQHFLIRQIQRIICHGLVLRGLRSDTYNPTRLGQARCLFTPKVQIWIY